MKIGLIDVDSHNFPNLALMKISAYHKAKGHDVEFATMFNHYDLIYKSKIFSWTIDPEYAYNCDGYMYGGTGYKIVNSSLPDKINNVCPDYSLYNCKHAYGFLTRGCIRKCSWCIVPKKEGWIRDENDIEDFISDKKSAILMDNNVLACEHGIRQIEKIIKLGIKIDFNQGLDARLIDDSMARLLTKVKWIRFMRMACDSLEQMKDIEKAVQLIRKYRKPEIFVYMLVKDFDDAMERAIFLKDLGVDPFAQAFRDFNNSEPTQEQKNFCRWVNHKAIFKTVLWEDYK